MFFFFIFLIPILQAEDLQDHSFLQSTFDGKLLAQVSPEDRSENGQWKILDFHWQDIRSPVVPEAPKSYRVIMPERKPMFLRIWTPKKPRKSIDPRKTELSLTWLPLTGDCHAPYWEGFEINERNLYMSRAGRPELINLIETIAQRVCQETGQPLFVNDLNGKGHEGHKRGIDADILIRLSDDVKFEGGRVGAIRGLNRGHDSSFQAGFAYDREETIGVIEKFLNYSKTVWLKEGKTLEKCRSSEERCKNGRRPRLVPCEAGEEGCESYEVTVIRVFTSDPEIRNRFLSYKDIKGKRIVQPVKVHANHFHVKIDFVKDDLHLGPILKQLQDMEKNSIFNKIPTTPTLTPWNPIPVPLKQQPKSLWERLFGPKKP